MRTGTGTFTQNAGFAASAGPGVSPTYVAIAVLAALALAGCGGSSSSPRPAPPAGPAAVTLTGFVSDGPVSGGSVHAFLAADIVAALDSAAGATNRAGALGAARPVAAAIRRRADGDAWTLDVGGDLAGEAVFIVFDNANSDDEEFGDTPPNLESVAILGGAGTTQNLNVSLHTTLIAQIVRAALDPDGDGTPIGAGAIAAAMQAGELDVIAAFGRDDDGEDLFGGERPLDTTDAARLHDASSLLGLRLRTSALVEGAAIEDIIAAVAADLADGAHDGAVSGDFPMSYAGRARRFRDFHELDRDSEIGSLAIGPCSTSAVTLRRACSANVVDDRFEGWAFCADISDDDERARCLRRLRRDIAETREECDDVFEARLELCAAIGDAAHDPAFGPTFAGQFVDPREIGTTVTPNPWYPLVPGNVWTYEGSFYDEEEDETITEVVTVTVLDRIKMIGGIPCVVVNDVVVSDDGAKEDTNDWLAQDVDGNVWYCGEISRDFEEFEDDDPVEFELVSTEGSWKHGRDGAEAGILLPAAPQKGTTIRQEVLFGEAEDVIEIVSLKGTESAPGGSCSGDCLVTRDFTPLDPEGAENKYYAPGIGLIVEVDPDTGDRLELQSFSTP